MATVARPPQRPYVPPPPRRRRGGWVPNLILSLLVVLLCAGIAAGVGLAAITRDLPQVGVLDDPTALGFKTAQIFDRKGQLLWEINDPQGGKRTVVGLRDVSKDLINATLAAEDVHFYEHQGFDVVATLRSAWIDLTQQGTTGASTITQQLVRNAILDPAEARQTTARRKLREMVLAYQVERRYSKDQILEMYLNRVYYGNQSYGIEAAAQSYFGASANQLDLAQAAMLTGLVQSPSQYDRSVFMALPHLAASHCQEETVRTKVFRRGSVHPPAANSAAWAMACHSPPFRGFLVDHRRERLPRSPPPAILLSGRHQVKPDQRPATHWASAAGDHRPPLGGWLA